jgi:hypothetical protein
MLKKQLDDALLVELTEPFLELGFELKKSLREFRKPLPSVGSVSVATDFLASRRRGFYHASVTAHIRIDELEDLYTPFNPLLTDGSRARHKTVNMNCDNLFTDKSLLGSFELSTTADVAAYARTLWQAIVMDVLPWLDAYSSRESLVASFRSVDPFTWPTSDRGARYCVLLSDSALRQDRVRFEAIAEEFLSFCDRPAGQRFLFLAKPTIDGMRARLMTVRCVPSN